MSHAKRRTVRPCPTHVATVAMFFIHFLEHVLTLHPSFFGSHVKEYLTQKLLDDVEGVCTGDYYIVCVMDTYDISEGRVMPGSGLAEYTIMYRAIVWKPFKGETVCRRTLHSFLCGGANLLPIKRLTLS